jgi:hypothetical protein
MGIVDTFPFIEGLKSAVKIYAITSREDEINEVKNYELESL